MKKVISTLLLSSLFISSCRKKTEITGVVYSKHNLPVPNAEVVCRYYKESNYSEGIASKALTNDRGEFQMEFRARKQKHEIKCFCDSGYARRNIEIGRKNTIDLFLN